MITAIGFFINNRNLAEIINDQKKSIENLSIAGKVCGDRVRQLNVDNKRLTYDVEQSIIAYKKLKTRYATKVDELKESIETVNKLNNLTEPKIQLIEKKAVPKKKKRTYNRKKK